MLTERQKEQFIPQLEEIIKEGLRKLKIVDTLQEKESIFPHWSGKFSDQGIDLDYQSLEIEQNRYLHSVQDWIHTFKDVWWITPYRIVAKNGAPRGNTPGKSFEGIVSEIKVRETYNPNTGESTLTLLNDLQSSVWVKR